MRLFDINKHQQAGERHQRGPSVWRSTFATTSACQLQFSKLWALKITRCFGRRLVALRAFGAPHEASGPAARLHCLFGFSRLASRLQIRAHILAAASRLADQAAQRRRPVWFLCRHFEVANKFNIMNVGDTKTGHLHCARGAWAQNGRQWSEKRHPEQETEANDGSHLKFKLRIIFHSFSSPRQSQRKRRQPPGLTIRVIGLQIGPL